MRFEWDENKDRLNQKNHDSIGFDFAILVFADENVLIEADRIENGEERWHAIGRVGGVSVLTVVHTMRKENGEEITRVISARAATKREIGRYFRQTIY